MSIGNCYWNPKGSDINGNGMERENLRCSPSMRYEGPKVVQIQA